MDRLTISADNAVVLGFIDTELSANSIGMQVLLSGHLISCLSDNLLQENICVIQVAFSRIGCNVPRYETNHAIRCRSVTSFRPNILSDHQPLHRESPD